MKKIEAIVRTSKLEKVREELAKINVNFFTFYDVQGFGKQKGAEIHYRGAIYDMASIPRTVIEIIVSEEKTDEIIQCIINSASTGEIGDGKIFVTAVERVFNIRKGEEGTSAL
ncbi:MAG: P-II family nitrogen regulator [Chitinophagales bacterium]